MSDQSLGITIYNYYEVNYKLVLSLLDVIKMKDSGRQDIDTRIFLYKRLARCQ